MSAGTATPGTMRRPDREALLGAVRRGGWTLGIYLVLFGLIVYTWVLNPRYGLDTLAMAALPLAFAAAAQWTRILAAGRVFEAWAPFLKEPSPPDP